MGERREHGEEEEEVRKSAEKMKVGAGGLEVTPWRSRHS